VRAGDRFGLGAATARCAEILTEAPYIRSRDLVLIAHDGLRATVTASRYVLGLWRLWAPPVPSAGGNRPVERFLSGRGTVASGQITAWGAIFRG
jgi:hypothetical protein